MTPFSFRSSLAALATTLLVGTVHAQCPYTTLSMQSYGQSCAPVFFGNPPTVSGSLNVNACTLELTVTAFSGCCNTFLTARVLALGVQPASIPVPQLGAGCTLLLQPFGTFFLPAAGGDTFTISLPPVAPPMSFHVQGAALYFTTIGFGTDAQLTDGQTVTLS